MKSTFFLIAMSSIMLGCANNTVSRQHALQMDINDSNNISVIAARSYMNEDDLIVSGAVRRNALRRSPIYGHVDILFANSDGNIIQESNVRCFPFRTSTHRSRSSFKKRFDSVPEGAKNVIVSYHNQYFYEDDHHVE